MELNKFPIYYVGSYLFSNANKAMTIENSKKIGEKKAGKVIYSKYDAYYLIEKNYAELIKNEKILPKEKALNMFDKDKKFLMKYFVYKHLRERGYVVKTGSKFGTEFRVYDKKTFNFQHAKWIVHVEQKKERLNTEEIISKVRISHSSGKKLLLAIVDSDESIIFYEVDWIKI